MNRQAQVQSSDLYEYLLVIDIPALLRERIEEERESLVEKYQLIQPAAGRPNISLARFSSLKQGEDRIISMLAQIAMEVKPFMIDLHNFSGYPMHAIFIMIGNQEKVLSLIRKLKKARNLMKAGGEDPYFLHDPTIPLVARMQKEKYTEAMNEYKDRKFYGQFRADAFLLLKRPKEEKIFTLVERFEFNAAKKMKGQGLLFR